MTEEQKIKRKEWCIRNRCKLNEYHKKWCLKNKYKLNEYRNKPEAKNCRKERRLQRGYGISIEQHKQMFISQDGKCAICDKHFDKSKDVHTDHNHITNQTRQLLCSGCNTGIGNFKENTQTLLNAVAYLNKWNPREN
jgi:hypothetical protein